MAGYITTANDVKKSLVEGNRDVFGNKTWSNMYSDVAYAQQSAENQLNKQFGEQVGLAYAASQQQRSQILGSNLGTNYQEAMLKSNEDALTQAYNSYLSSLGQAKADVTAQAQQGYATINKALTTEAENVAAYQKAHFDYYDYLVENYSNDLLKDEMWTGYRVLIQAVDEQGNPKVDEQGNPIYETDEQGNVQYRMKTRQELINAGYDVVDDRKEWRGLYDDKGNLTIRGADFFDLMQNYFAGRTDNIESFDVWLSENNEELLDWANTYNPYDYTEDMTHRGSFKTMVGLTSTDYTYQFAERFGGLTTGEVTKMYDRFTKKAEEFQNISSERTKNKGQEITGLIRTSTQDLKKVASDLGITEKELGFSWKDLEYNMDKLYNGTQSEAEMAGRWFGNFVAGASSGAALGGSIGAAAGSTVGPLGTTVVGLAGVIIGGIVGAVGGSISGSVRVDQFRNQNKLNVQQATDMYANTVNAMINYSLKKKREQEIEFYNNNKVF